MSEENWNFQVNLKVPVDPKDNYRDALVNVRATDRDDLEYKLAGLTDLVEPIVNLAAKLTAVSYAVAGLGATVLPQANPNRTTSAPQSAPAQQAPQQSQNINRKLAPEDFEWQLPLEQLNLNGLEFFYFNKKKKDGTPTKGGAYKNPQSGDVVHWAKWLKND